MKFKDHNLYFILRNDHPNSTYHYDLNLESLKQLGEKWLIDKDYSTQLIFDIFKDEHTHIGFFQFSNIKWINRKAEITFVLFESYQHQGYGNQILSPFLSLAFNTYNFHRLEAEVYETNPASIHLLEKSGFILEGRKREAKFQDGKYIDILCYGLLAKDYNLR
ncbi:MAG: hypothetical protein Kow00108_05430 [Calditrichia bacterium]